MHQLADSSGVKLELSFAIITTCLLFTFTRIVAIRYGDEKITHITLRPYYISFGLLSVMLVEILYYLAQVEVYYSRDWDAFFQSLNDDGFSQFMIQVISQSKFIVIICFVMARTFEHEILVFFIRY